MCGGTCSSKSHTCCHKGLSPRVRGNPDDTVPMSNQQRSIPACAGEPATNSGLSPRIRVYPRVCGGTQIGHLPAGERNGLSPRVRGNLQFNDRLEVRLRSIPACAGEPPEDSENARKDEVYPRVCGGTRPRRLPQTTTRGLSPRVRGNRVIPLDIAASNGSIPACAGEPNI